MKCIIIDDDIMSRKVLENFIEQTDNIELQGSFESPIKAYSIFQEHNDIDIIFLDMEMPEMNGLDFLNTLENPPMIIIVSGKQDYALESYEHNVLDYLLKPITLPRFYKAINKANNRLQERETISQMPQEIFIKKKNATLVRLRYDDILWVEALENYVTINTFDDKFTIHFTMKSIENKLPLEMFKRVHRSYIVNINNINVIEDNSIILKTQSGSKFIPIGKSYKDDLMNDLNLISK